MERRLIVSQATEAFAKFLNKNLEYLHFTTKISSLSVQIAKEDNHIGDPAISCLYVLQRTGRSDCSRYVYSFVIALFTRARRAAPLKRHYRANAYTERSLFRRCDAFSSKKEGNADTQDNTDET